MVSKIQSLRCIRAGFVGVFILIAVRAFAAIAGQPDAADVKTIDSCLADATTSKSDPDNCIGKFAKSCAEKAATLAATLECNNRELLVWHVALSRDYARLSERLVDVGAKQALGDVERAFLIAKEKLCAFERIAHKNSPDGLAAAARCDLKATARQDLWLIQQVNSFNSP